MKILTVLAVIITEIAALLGGFVAPAAFAAGPPIVETRQPNVITDNAASMIGAVDSNGSFTSAFFEYGKTPSFGRLTTHVLMGDGSGLRSMSVYEGPLEPATTYYYRVMARNEFGTTFGETISFVTAPRFVPVPLPPGGGFGGYVPPEAGNTASVLTKPAGNVNRDAVTLYGLVNPNNAFTDVYFEYGTSLYLGQVSGNQSLANGNAYVSVSTVVDKLFPNTKYYFRVVARNRFGTSIGNMEEFTTGLISGGGAGSGTAVGTAPTVMTIQASNMSDTSATLNASVTAGSNLTTAWFDYGLTPALGSQTIYRQIGSSADPAGFAETLTGLLPGITYYYRVSAQNGYGVRYGEIRNFRTFGGTVVIPPVPSAPPAPPVAAPTPAPAPIPVTVLIEKARGSAALALTSSLDRNRLVVPTIDNTRPMPGDTLTYTVVYRNTGSAATERLTLTLIVPEGVEYKSAYPSPTTVSVNGVTFTLRELTPNDEGMVVARLTVSESTAPDTELKFTAVLSYLDGTRTPRSESANLAVRVAEPGSEDASQLASAFGTTNGIGSSFWLMILLLVITSSHFFYQYLRDKRMAVADVPDEDDVRAERVLTSLRESREVKEPKPVNYNTPRPAVMAATSFTGPREGAGQFRQRGDRNGNGNGLRNGSAAPFVNTDPSGANHSGRENGDYAARAQTA